VWTTRDEHARHGVVACLFRPGSSLKLVPFRSEDGASLRPTRDMRAKVVSPEGDPAYFVPIPMLTGRRVAGSGICRTRPPSALPQPYSDGQVSTVRVYPLNCGRMSAIRVYQRSSGVIGRPSSISRLGCCGPPPP
jgi:hypothetical protein